MKSHFWIFSLKNEVCLAFVSLVNLLSLVVMCGLACHSSVLVISSLIDCINSSGYVN